VRAIGIIHLTQNAQPRDYRLAVTGAEFLERYPVYGAQSISALHMRIMGEYAFDRETHWLKAANTCG
jgi:hypothetical protein